MRSLIDTLVAVLALVVVPLISLMVLTLQLDFYLQWRAAIGNIPVDMGKTHRSRGAR